MKAAIQRLLPIIIGSIGATSQALILFHLLADCYPYKMMSQPPSKFYLVIACVGGLASPIAAVTAAWLLCTKFKVISALPAVAALMSHSYSYLSSSWHISWPELRCGHRKISTRRLR